MKFILVMQQKGEGCDYTIGCGIKYYIITATSHVEAEEWAKKYIKENYPPGDDYELDRVYLGIFLHTLPLGKWYNEIEEIEAKKAQDIVEKSELAELARLKAKYEGSK